MTAHLPPVPNCNYSCNNVLEKSRYSALDKWQVLGKLRTPMHWLSNATLTTLLCHSVVLSQSLAWDIPARRDHLHPQERALGSLRPAIANAHGMAHP